MKILGFDITRQQEREATRECMHEDTRCVNFDEGVYYCDACHRACIYIGGALNVLTLENMSENDKG